jgi:hypothetical protein
MAAFGRFLTLRRLCMALPVMLILPFFGATFTNLKVLIPAIVPFRLGPDVRRIGIGCCMAAFTPGRSCSRSSAIPSSRR